MTDIKPIDIFVLCWNRVEFTKRTIQYLHERTRYPFRIIVINNHSDDDTQEVLEDLQHQGKVFHIVNHGRNVGVHQGWNTALGLADGEYFITTDNDIYVPQVDPDWLTQMVQFMDNRLDYGAIALQPHMFLGCVDPFPDESGVTEVGHCGAVMRLMRTKSVRDAGGWDRHYDANRNHEETTICSRLKTLGYKCGYASHLRAYHDWGEDNNWGYGDVHPHIHGHRIPGGSMFAEGGSGELWPSPEALKNQDSAFDTQTWTRKV